MHILAMEITTVTDMILLLTISSGDRYVFNFHPSFLILVIIPVVSTSDNLFFKTVRSAKE